MSQSRKIIIGDVHGHYDGLMRLMEAIAPASNDEVYFLGDLIDRGEKSAQVLDFIQSSGYISLLGNHEQMLLEAFPNGKVSTQALQTWLYSGGQSTVSSYDQPEQLLEKLDWIRTFPTHLDLGHIWLVHAGLHPELTLENQTRHEFCWIREPFHSSTKPYFPNKLIVTGHTITFTLPNVTPGKIARGKGWIGIDTGVYHPKSGWLTAFDATNNVVHQVHVFSHVSRTSDLEDVVTDIDPSQIRSRRQFSLL
ncbi:MAG: metallophosphoesterase family protein [Leptolyngbyaceae bacterium]|nr:metallophosphoesterase family protein [Leptolyngbyaceae bacterium]